LIKIRKMAITTRTRKYIFACGIRKAILTTAGRCIEINNLRKRKLSFYHIGGK